MMEQKHMQQAKITDYDFKVIEYDWVTVQPLTDCNCA